MTTRKSKPEATAIAAEKTLPRKRMPVAAAEQDVKEPDATSRKNIFDQWMPASAASIFREVNADEFVYNRKRLSQSLDDIEHATKLARAGEPGMTTEDRTKRLMALTRAGDTIGYAARGKNDGSKLQSLTRTFMTACAVVGGLGMAGMVISAPWLLAAASVMSQVGTGAFLTASASALGGVGAMLGSVALNHFNRDRKIASRAYDAMYDASEALRKLKGPAVRSAFNAFMNADKHTLTCSQTWRGGAFNAEKIGKAKYYASLGIS